MKKQIVAIIPARYNSSRLPGKPLAQIGNKSMVQLVYKQVCKATNISKVIIATDDERIVAHCNENNMLVMLTSVAHLNGTTRCLEVAEKLNLSADDVVINVQGDEPFINPFNIDSLANLFEKPTTQIASLYKQITDLNEIENPNVVKVVLSNLNYALYFSRCTIPYIREEKDSNFIRYFKHIGLYAYKFGVLKSISQLPESNLERAEKLEQLRWLQNDYTILMHQVFDDNVAVDTPEDLLEANEYWQRLN